MSKAKNNRVRRAGGTSAAASVRVHLRNDCSVKKGLKILKRLSLSKRFSDGFLRALERRFFHSIEIKDMDRPAGRAGMFFRVSIAEGYLELLSALLATDRLCDRKIPFHNS